MKWFLALAAVFAAGCAGESEPIPKKIADAGVDAPACDPGSRAVEGRGCVPAGIQDDGCPAGQLTLEDGTCRAAGIPPDLCGDGFTADGEGGCTAILPAKPCAPGTMAIPGDTQCHAVADCGAGTWGDIPVEPDTEYVDSAYTGGGSDGTAAKPWTALQDGIDNAASGAIVAVAAGSYAEDVTIEGKPVRLWGRCPSLVEIAGTAAALAAVEIFKGAAGAELHHLAVRGAAIGIGVTGSQDVLLREIWVHDTASRALDVEDAFGPTRVAVEGSLLEGAHELAVFVAGSELTLEATVVRRTEPDASNKYGRGFGVEPSPATGRRCSIAIRSSVLDGNHSDGIYAAGSDVGVETSVVQNTEVQPLDQNFGRGVNVIDDAKSGERASLSVRASVLDHNRDIGLLVMGSDATIEATTVKGTRPVPSGTSGIGVAFQANDKTGQPAKGAVESSVIDDNHTFGMLVRGAEAAITGTIIRRTQPEPSDQDLGIGIDVEDDPTAGKRSTLALRASVLDQNHRTGLTIFGSDVTIEGTVVSRTDSAASDQTGGSGIDANRNPDTGQRTKMDLRASVVQDNRSGGVLVSGSDATIEATVVTGTQSQVSDGNVGWGIAIMEDTASHERAMGVVRWCLVDHSSDIGLFVGGSDATVEATRVADTAPRTSDQTGGRGINVEANPATGTRANATIRGSLVERSVEFGILTIGSDTTTEGTVVMGTQARPLDGTFGDGMAGDSELGSTTVTITGCRIETSARAGISAFGSSIAVGDTTLECNPIDLDGERWAESDYAFTDLGSNVCGCTGATNACKVVSSNLEPPTVSDVPP